MLQKLGTFLVRPVMILCWIVLPPVFIAIEIRPQVTRKRLWLGE
jgi:hypothetical protein